MNNMVDHPDHYVSKEGLEVIDVIEAFTADLKGIEATDTANIIKYACRWKHKNGVQDLKKLIWYANHLVDYLERKEKIKTSDKEDEKNPLLFRFNPDDYGFLNARDQTEWFSNRMGENE